jgi:hypothetical protein
LLAWVAVSLIERHRRLRRARENLLLSHGRGGPVPPRDDDRGRPAGSVRP